MLSKLDAQLSQSKNKRYEWLLHQNAATCHGQISRKHFEAMALSKNLAVYTDSVIYDHGTDKKVYELSRLR